MEDFNINYAMINQRQENKKLVWISFWFLFPQSFKKHLLYAVFSRCFLYISRFKGSDQEGGLGEGEHQTDPIKHLVNNVEDGVEEARIIYLKFSPNTCTETITTVPIIPRISTWMLIMISCSHSPYLSLWIPTFLPKKIIASIWKNCTIDNDELLYIVK